MSVVSIVDRILAAAVLVLFCRGCCVEERVLRSVVQTGFYRTPEGEMAPLEGLTMFVDGANDRVRFEYAHEAGTVVVVEYEATSRRFTDD